MVNLSHASASLIIECLLATTFEQELSTPDLIRIPQKKRNTFGDLFRLHDDGQL